MGGRRGRAGRGRGQCPLVKPGGLFFIGPMILRARFLLPMDGPPLEGFAIKGPTYVLAAILVFAALIRGVSLAPIGIPVTLPSLGLVVSTFAAFVISIMGSSEMKWVESLIAAVAMTAFCVGLFVYLLGLPFQLWPAF